MDLPSLIMMRIYISKWNESFLLLWVDINSKVNSVHYAIFNLRPPEVSLDSRKLCGGDYDKLFGNFCKFVAKIVHHCLLDQMQAVWSYDHFVSVIVETAIEYIQKGHLLAWDACNLLVFGMSVRVNSIDVLVPHLLQAHSNLPAPTC